MPVNKRIYYAVKAVGIAECGTNSFTTAHGVQSAGLNTQFNLDQVFELGQIEVYELIEGLPNVEATIEKVLDGYPLLYHLASKGATSATLGGRSVKRGTVAMSFFSDDQDAASGTAISSVICSGMYVNNISYTFPVQGNATESVTMVGNNKIWYTGGSYSFNPAFDNADAPIGTGGVQRRENFLLGSAGSRFPTQIPGVSSTGTIDLQSDGAYSVHLQRVQVSTSLGRTELLELGHRNPYHRAADFPVKVTSEIEIYSTKGDLINAVDNADNIVDQTMRIWTEDGMKIDLGTKNKLQSITAGGANAQENGGNETITYSYLNYNKMTVTHPQDPSAL